MNLLNVFLVIFPTLVWLVNINTLVGLALNCFKLATINHSSVASDYSNAFKLSPFQGVIQLDPNLESAIYLVYAAISVIWVLVMILTIISLICFNSIKMLAIIAPVHMIYVSFRIICLLVRRSPNIYNPIIIVFDLILAVVIVISLFKLNQKPKQTEAASTLTYRTIEQITSNHGYE